MKIIIEGERDRGAVIGSDDFKEIYVTNKVNKWIANKEDFSVPVAKDKPQVVYSCFTKTISKRWTYVHEWSQVSYHHLHALQEAIEGCD